MKNLSIENITKACRGTFHGDKSILSQEVSGVVIDSRKVQPGYLFVSIDGERVNAHKFIPDTVKAGAMCVVSHEDLGETDFPYILVESTGQALLDIAKLYRDSFDMKVVGITGSVGKTSTKEMIASVLSQKYSVLKTEGNFNNEIGLPLTVFNLRKEHEIAVLEMGISGFEEMTRLAKVARPDICVLTNIGVAHMENLGSRDGILKAKTEMFAYMNENGTIILNGDDDKLRGYSPENGITPVYFGLDESCGFHAENISGKGLNGTDAQFFTPNSSFTAHINIPGAHMVYNALAATAVGYALGMTDREICAGIEANVPIAGRNNLIRAPHFTIIDDCYNANPTSMKASLDVLAFADTRKAAILGDMFELGENEKQMHREVGIHAVRKGIDVLICIGSLMKSAADGALEYLEQQKNAEHTEETPSSSAHFPTQICHFATKADFLREAKELLKEGDTVLVKASHGMEFPEIVEFLQQ